MIMMGPSNFDQDTIIHNPWEVSNFDISLILKQQEYIMQVDVS